MLSCPRAHVGATSFYNVPSRWNNDYYIRFGIGRTTEEGKLYCFLSTRHLFSGEGCRGCYGQLHHHTLDEHRLPRHAQRHGVRAPVGERHRCLCRHQVAVAVTLAKRNGRRRPSIARTDAINDKFFIVN